ncbi:hypothetical protein WR25_05734 [Diploscapter pachys]|uniref:Uncharacterized protein n=1 Tax=Diploscapter pachys TaxID=2018661 RepID=A0A2A2M3P1_9BILA|nr:hypothetical protein WR25_05734 [Diploscapter pachys]
MRTISAPMPTATTASAPPRIQPIHAASARIVPPITAQPAAMRSGRSRWRSAQARRSSVAPAIPPAMARSAGSAIMPVVPSGLGPTARQPDAASGRAGRCGQAHIRSVSSVPLPDDDLVRAVMRINIK